jgi:dTDP-4-amino-4,6-dideoxygalactose transaminase
MFGYRSGTYPRSERLSKECLSLPMHPFLSDEDVRYVCENISLFGEGDR